MTQDLTTDAMQRYHDLFDSVQYNTIGEFLASNLNADRDDQRVVDGMIAVQNAAFELCGKTDVDGAWHKLAVLCGQSFLSFHTVDAMRDFLRRFAPDDMRIDDFEATAKGMLRAYSGLDDLKTAAAHANGVHSWRGRMAYELLAAVDYLTQTAIQLLAHGDDTYTREKLYKGLNRITGALYEGIRHSEQPALYDSFGSTPETAYGHRDLYNRLLNFRHGGRKWRASGHSTECGCINCAANTPTGHRSNSHGHLATV